MYITNPESIPKDKVCWCNQVISEWLIKNHIPLLCRKGRMSGFMITEALGIALEKMPFWLKVTKMF